MNTWLKSLSAALLALAASLAMATEPSAWERIKSFAHTSKTEAVAEGKKMIAATDRQIAELKTQTAQSVGETKKAHAQNMKELQARRQQAQAELDKMEKSAASTWDATKDGFSKAYKDLQESYDKAKAAATAK